MPGYDNSTRRMPSLAEIVAAVRKRRARNPGDRPDDASGRQANVSIEGEPAIQAQPVAPQAGGVSVGIGPVTRSATLPPQRFQISGQPSAQVDPRGAKVQQLMARGMSYEQAMRTVMAGG